MKYNLVPEKTELASLLCACTNSKTAELADRYTELKSTRSAPLPKAGTEEEQNFLLSCPQYSIRHTLKCLICSSPFVLAIALEQAILLHPRQAARQANGAIPWHGSSYKHGIFPWGCFVWAVLWCKGLTGRKNWSYKVSMPCWERNTS